MATESGERVTTGIVVAHERDVVGLSCITLRSPDPQAWSPIGRDVLSSDVVEQPGAVSLTFPSGKSLRFVDDERCPQVQIRWAVSSPNAVRRVVERAGDAATSATTISDPDGVVSELVDRAHDAPKGQPDLGHLVAGVGDLDAATGFYTEILGLQISDRVRIPLAAGGKSLGVFLRGADHRHHSLALISATPGIRHVMVELPDVDAVGRAIDACHTAGIDMTRTLGRHTNDQMLSFYFRGPDGYEVEVGCGGIVVDDGSWTPAVHEGPSEWGHQFVNRVPQTEGNAG